MANLFLCPDDFWRCPIDLNHRVLAKRFPYHIRRCMAANPHIQRVRCVFNANHLTTPELFLDHVSTCPDAIDRSTVLLGLTKTTSFDRRNSSTDPNRRIFHDVNATEDWDEDIREREARRKSFILSNDFVEKNLDDIPKKVARKALLVVFDKNENDGRDHPVESEDLAEKLKKIRSLQLLGGAGRGVFR